MNASHHAKAFQCGQVSPHRLDRDPQLLGQRSHLDPSLRARAFKNGLVSFSGVHL